MGNVAGNLNTRLRPKPQEEFLNQLQAREALSKDDHKALTQIVGSWRNVDMNWLGMRLIEIASRDGKSQCLLSLISKGADVNYTNENNESPLFFAARNGHLLCVDHLLSKEADVHLINKDGNTAVATAAKCGHLSCVNLLLEHGAHLEETWMFAMLHSICKSGHAQKLRQFLASANCDLNHLNDQGLTALHYAAGSKSSKIVQLLLEKEANVGLVNRRGEEALHIAARKGDYESVALLVDKKANLNAQTVKGDSPLHVAARCSHLNVVKALFGRTDKSSNRKINHLLKFQLPLQIARLILDFSRVEPDLYLRDGQGQIPIDLARKSHVSRRFAKRKEQTVLFLQERMGVIPRYYRHSWSSSNTENELRKLECEYKE